MTEAPVVTRLFLVRHAAPGETDGRICGRRDVAAGDLSSDDIARCAYALPGNAVWISSPLRRARETAEALHAAAGETGTITVEPDLAEQDFGAWEGRDASEVWSGIGAEHWRRPSAIQPPDGESFAAVHARTAAAVSRIVSAHGGSAVVAVCHAGPIRAAIAHALGADADTALRIAVAPLSASLIEAFHESADGLSWSVGYVNRVW